MGLLWRTTFCLLIGLCGMGSYGLQAQRLSMTPVPDWVRFSDTTLETKLNKYEMNSGYYYKDFEVVSHQEKRQHVYKTKAKIVNQSGVDELSKLNISIDTSFQEIAFHYLKVRRDGKEVDRTDKLSFNFMNDENQLGSNIYTGIMKANAVLDDIRRDDEIEICYSIIGKNPLYVDELCELMYLEDYNHMDRVRLRLITPLDYAYDYKISRPGGVSLEEYEEGEYKHLVATTYNVSPPEFDESMSLSSRPYNELEISSLKKWEAVRLWAEGLFEPELSPSLKEVCGRIDAEHSSITAKATAALEYVQNKVRYTSINGGIGSLKASKPSVVLDRLYGDCKDKSLLLVAMLRELGVEKAYPVLVNGYAGRRLNEYLPGYHLFDHAIVTCEIEGQAIWVDPSYSLQGGDIFHRQSYDYGYALVLDGQSDGLVQMQVEDDYSSIEITEVFDFSDVKKDGLLTVTTVYKGKNADEIRNTYDQYSPKEIAESFKTVYSTIFLDVREEDRVKVEDDYAANVFSTIERYRIGKPWSKDERNPLMWSFSYEPMNVYNYVTPTACDPIHYPIDMNTYTRYLQNTTFHLPSDAIYVLSNSDTKNKVYNFKKEQTITSLSRTDLTYEFSMHSKSLLPEDFYEICEDINENSRNLQLSVGWIGNKE